MGEAVRASMRCAAQSSTQPAAADATAATSWHPAVRSPFSTKISKRSRISKDNPLAETFCNDLETGAPFPLQDRQFNGVVVTNYLWRDILSNIWWQLSRPAVF